MHERWQNRLSEYVDGELSAAERAECESHLAECSRCRDAVAEVQQVVERAQYLTDRPPPGDLWAGIAERLGAPVGVVDLRARRRVRRVSFSVPQLMAAGVALMLVSAGGMWLAMSGRSVVPVEAGGSRGGPVGMAVPASATDYDAAVAELERELTARRSQLDSATVRVLEENLLVIDRAIDEARSALEKDPGNAYLNQHLAQTMWGKVRLLRRATAMTALAS